MDKRALRVLEYEKIIEILMGYAHSQLGRERIGVLEPSGDRHVVEQWLDETTQAESIVVYNGNSPVESFPDIRGILKRARIGSVLSAGDLLKVGRVLQVAHRLYKEVEKFPEKDRISIVYNRVGRLNYHLHLMEEIFRCIESEEYISDYASSELANIRRRIKRTHDKVRDRLNKITHSTSMQKYLQEPIVTIRNDRYVVPVKQEHRGSISGIVHDQSSSGATLFIEPISVVEANNELREWILKEEKEIEKILAQFTVEVERVYDDLMENLEMLIELDMVFAKGSFSRAMRCVCPKLVGSHQVKIVKGRHPLINTDEVVPVTLELGRGYNTMVITGPNTGGKTVTLKTVGLFVLMTQSGLHLPANPGTEMGVFPEVFADIGDEQSIEQSLSTFSSHMTNIARIINNARMGALVLFDELGAGTDPVEGAALAMSILSDLHDRGILTIATTHYSELKVFALTREGMENASMEFDVETLRPTYHLLVGVPGRSNAFEISRRLGLPEGLIDSAREHLSQEDVHFEDIITNMEQNRRKAQEERHETRRQLDEIHELKAKVEEEKDELKNRRATIIKEAREEARRVLREAKNDADIIIRDLNKISRNVQKKEQRRAVEDTRSRLKGKLDKMDETLNISTKPSEGLVKPPENLKPGESVYIVNLDQSGQVLNDFEGGDEIQVQVGIMKVNVHRSNLRRVKETEDKKIITKRNVVPRNKPTSGELDLRGQNVEEALITVDRYLDDVFLAGLKEVVLIHGKGTGVLRNGVHQHLRKHPHVKSFRLGRFGEGETGVTIVELK